MLDENADINVNLPSLYIHKPKIEGPSLYFHGSNFIKIPKY